MKAISDTFEPRHPDRTWVRIAGTVLLPALPAGIAMSRHFGADGVWAAALAAFLAAAVVIVPPMLIPHGRSIDGPARVLGLTAVRMFLFLVVAVSVMFAADDALRAPAVLLFTGFYLLAFSVGTVAEVWAARQAVGSKKPGAEETR